MAVYCTRRTEKLFFPTLVPALKRHVGRRCRRAVRVVRMRGGTLPQPRRSYPRLQCVKIKKGKTLRAPTALDRTRSRPVLRSVTQPLRTPPTEKKICIFIKISTCRLTALLAGAIVS